MRLVRLLVILAGVTVSAGAGAQESLALGAAAPVVDGTVAPGEYSFTKESGLMVLSVSRTADTLALAVTGTTVGWVGVGVGAAEMNGATIFMGFVDRAGRVSFKPQAGQPGNTHSDMTPDILRTVRSYALKETGETTTLEVALATDAYIRKGQESLDLIFAAGPDDTFTEYHLDRDFISIPLSW